MKLLGSLHLLVYGATVHVFYESHYDKTHNTCLEMYEEVTTSLVEHTSSFMFQGTLSVSCYAVSCLELPKVPF